MGKHRKKQHYRRMVIAAVAVSAVGIPSAAMASTDWGIGTEPPATAAGQPVSPQEWYDASPASHWNQAWWGTEADAATPSAPGTPTAPPSVPQHTQHPHKHKHHKHPHKHHKHKHHKRPHTTTAAPSAPSTPRTTAPSAPTPAPAAPSAPKATATPSAPKATATASGTVARIVQLVNAERSKVGCSALTLNATLTKAAQAHSADMAAHQNMSHTGSDGSSPGDRITSAGYNWSAYGENVAYGYSTPEQVMEGWMTSAGHRANILNCSFKEIGVGLAQPGSYWTQDFGTAR
ncbi:CAP domain-containing protein [Streptomyces sp. NPDC047085]|uniref:CAP domain-containing protein n=1 Tax=Streptomyces sp. NPDC047085 TaxID=3155140 RepID=UPI0033C2D210